MSTATDATEMLVALESVDGSAQSYLWPKLLPGIGNGKGGETLANSASTKIADASTINPGKPKKVKTTHMSWFHEDISYGLMSPATDQEERGKPAARETVPGEVKQEVREGILEDLTISTLTQSRPFPTEKSTVFFLSSDKEIIPVPEGAFELMTKFTEQPNTLAPSDVGSGIPVDVDSETLEQVVGFCNVYLQDPSSEEPSIFFNRLDYATHARMFHASQRLGIIKLRECWAKRYTIAKVEAEALHQLKLVTDDDKQHAALPLVMISKNLPNIVKEMNESGNQLDAIVLLGVRSGDLEKVLQFCDHFLTEPMEELNGDTHVQQQWYKDFAAEILSDDGVFLRVLALAEALEIGPLLDLILNRMTHSSVLMMTFGKEHSRVGPYVARVNYEIGGDRSTHAFLTIVGSRQNEGDVAPEKTSVEAKSSFREENHGNNSPQSDDKIIRVSESTPAASHENTDEKRTLWGGEQRVVVNDETKTVSNWNPNSIIERAKKEGCDIGFSKNRCYRCGWGKQGSAHSTTAPRTSKDYCTVPEKFRYHEKWQVCPGYDIGDSREGQNPKPFRGGWKRKRKRLGIPDLANPDYDFYENWTAW